jgi:glycine/D-amino acid oxidase-like deaminating enzyme
MRCAWFAEEGRIDLEALLEGFERGARGAGVRFETCSGVTEFVRRSGAVAGARLSGGREIEAERTVIAAGGWAGPLAAAAGSRVRLRPTRRHLVVTEPDPRVAPGWPVVWVENDDFYARPEAGGLLLCACDVIDSEPDEVAVEKEVLERILGKTTRWLPGLAPARVARFWSGVRTLTSDGRFVIGADADLPGLFWAAGLGGHGMICGAVVGELAAACLMGETLIDPAAAACDPARFALAPSTPP